MAEPFGPDGSPVESTIELFEFSGPVSPRFQYTTHVLMRAHEGRYLLSWEQKDASGPQTHSGELSRQAYSALWDALLGILPMGTHLDLAEGLRGRKGISFNQVTLSLGEGRAWLGYVLSHLDQEAGDPRARTLVEAIRSAAALPQPRFPEDRGGN